ncbi:uncharacterized protein [Typha angustifolia]|uniref:uncharacterized protein isoform X2 n=1 Tax=Typha angustifolia TaxID=59011 RepID=UPI003C2CBE3B
MSLRQLQRRSAALLRDGGVLRALRSELNHELSSSSPPPPDPSQSQKSEILVDEFALEWDSPRVQDVVLRRRHGGHAEEDISVSALLAPLRFRGEDPLPRDALMKVCIKKPQFGPVLHFDCRIFHRQEVEQLECGDSDFIVKGVYYHPSVDSLGDSKYKGPIFRWPNLFLANNDESKWYVYTAVTGCPQLLTQIIAQVTTWRMRS